MMKCTNCFKKYEKEEKCSQCGTELGTEFICIRIEEKSAHFCSKTCANKVLVAASYLPDRPVAKGPAGGYECRKCGYHFLPEDMEEAPKLCPACASPDLTRL
ncbi:MAG: hypothetical protein QW590_00320 [Candidatus Bilamarchaeaceae archaeon]